MRIKQLLWRQVLIEGERDRVFIELIKDNNLHGVQYCLEQEKSSTNSGYGKRLVDLDVDNQGNFPLLLALQLPIDCKNMCTIILGHHYNNARLQTSNEKRENAFMLAAKKGHYDMICKLFSLFESKNRITVCCNDGMNALMYASLNGHADVVKFLLPEFERDEQIFTRSRAGLNAMDYARKSQNENVVNQLVPFFNNIVDKQENDKKED